MLKLRLASKYSREDVHSLFSPETVFTLQAGTWGWHGFIPIPERVTMSFLLLMAKAIWSRIWWEHYRGRSFDLAVSIKTSIRWGVNL